MTQLDPPRVEALNRTVKLVAYSAYQRRREFEDEGAVIQAALACEERQYGEKG